MTPCDWCNEECELGEKWVIDPRGSVSVYEGESERLKGKAPNANANGWAPVLRKREGKYKRENEEVGIR